MLESRDRYIWTQPHLLCFNALRQGEIVAPTQERRGTGSLLASQRQPGLLRVLRQELRPNVNRIGFAAIPWPVLSQQEQTGYIILAIALVALLWFLTQFVRAMLIVLITGGLALFWAYWIHMFWPQSVPLAFFAALIVATVVVGRKLVDAELNPKKPSSGAHSH
jgi:hypothetical protein